MGDYQQDDSDKKAKNLIDKLNKVWIDETFSPDILINKMGLIHDVMKKIKQSENSQDSNEVVASIQKLEVERFKYILSRYVFTRLNKIELYSLYIMTYKDDSYINKLTNDEYIYCAEYYENLKTHLFENALKNMPFNMQSIDYNKIGHRPNLEHYVFMKANEDIINEHSILDQSLSDTSLMLEQPEYMSKDSQYIIKFKAILDSLGDEKITLL
ncbi:unnamed protein product [Gordionus sp. m RMFG-2023]|uniref:DNA replication complex GINS protein SLD5-like n=1 Tax=Gordionus sp. m RMFG-2023 TaxID=3053472 RepID=UPI0030E59374